MRATEAIVLRTYPLKESDLIVSFLARDLGKLRGVARRARKPGSRFGSGLERLSYIKLFHLHRENRELDSLDSCEIIRSRFPLAGHYEIGVALDYFAEVSDHILPPAEPNERFFRLLLAVTDHLVAKREAGLWEAVLYFTLWSVKLGGFLAPVRIDANDQALAEEILRVPVGRLGARDWSRQTGEPLRRQLMHLIEDHTERRLVTAQYLEAL